MNIYVCEGSTHSIQVIRKDDGQSIRHWRRYGRGEGDFYYPRGILLHQDLFYVSDRCPIEVFTKMGMFVQVIGPSEGSFQQRQESFPRGMCIIDNLFMERGNERVQVFSN